ncbi:MAG: 4-hydroxy-tetrahydrodipicolinate reductase [Halobacteriales archaeon]
MSLQIAVTGAGGRMGRTVIATAIDRDDVEVAAAVNRSSTEPIGDISIDPATELSTRLDDTNPDVLIDFTAPVATLEYVAVCADVGVPVVTGTTGFSDDQATALAEYAATIPILRAANFSPGIVVLRRAVETVTRLLPDYDIELTETHHSGKRDAPSGTAQSLLASITAARDRPTTLTHGREGDRPTDHGEIGVHARRAGDVTGAHDLLFAGSGEVLELRHQVGSRTVFAAGALDAAAWIVDQAPGEYDFEAVFR